MSLPELQEHAIDLVDEASISETYGNIAMMSSFGASSAALLHLIARV